MKLTGYKLFRKMKNGYAPLFIDATNRLQLGETQECKTGLVKKGFAPRDGWHGCFKPNAPHLMTNPKNGAQRVWMEVEVTGWINTYERPEAQGGTWFTCQNIKLVKELNDHDVWMINNKDSLLTDLIKECA
ncbi:hypothetical protein AB4380_03860 [Vibrio breoganii]